VQGRRPVSIHACLASLVKSHSKPVEVPAGIAGSEINRHSAWLRGPKWTYAMTPLRGFLLFMPATLVILGASEATEARHYASSTLACLPSDAGRRASAILRPR
jgi:hypothetical protein